MRGRGLVRRVSRRVRGGVARMLYSAPHDPIAGALLLIGWAAFGVLLVGLAVLAVTWGLVR